MIEIKSEWDAVERELDRLSNMPGPKTRFELQGALELGFVWTQAAVHVQSGALKASGKVEPSKSKAMHKWSGEISYGNAGAVDYAIYEKRRGVHWAGASSAKGDHDFMRPLDALDPLFVTIIMDGLRK